MSRYVDLEGKTWDGTTITSKIQEVKTRYGYMQGITVGWLWGDNVPHIDLEEHDKEIYNKALDDVVKFAEGHKSIYNAVGISDCVVDIIKVFAEQLKGGGENE